MISFNTEENAADTYALLKTIKLHSVPLPGVKNERGEGENLQRLREGYNIDR